MKRGATGCLLALVSAAAVAGAEPPPRRLPSEIEYFAAMQQQKLIEKGSGTLAQLNDAVRRADELIVEGEVGRAAEHLYAIVEGGRFADHTESDAYQNAEYLLGVALSRGGAATTAHRYLERVAARAGTLHAAPALRHLIDMSLAAHDAGGGARRLLAAGIKPAEEPLAQEIDYLRGRAALDSGQLDVAADELRRVGTSCRFYSSALYLRGVIAARRGDFVGAQDAFCSICDTRPGDPLRFVVDGRYFTLRDLARLGLGRVAHEQGRYDDAFYHYFQIPSDSKDLEKALFESAWSMLQRRRFDLASRLVDELMKEFPKSPLRPDAELLWATLRVKTCRFAEATRGFSAFLTAYEPVDRLVAEAERDPAARRALARRLLVERKAEGAGDDELTRLERLLVVEPAFHRLRELSRGLRADAAGAASLEATWKDLETRVNKTAVQPTTAAPVSDDTAALLADTLALGGTIAELRDEVVLARSKGKSEVSRRAREEAFRLTLLEARRGKLAVALRQRLATETEAATPTGTSASLSGKIALDRAAVASLRARAVGLAERLERRQSELLLIALGQLRTRLGGMLRQARLGKIDSVVGEKKKLEKEIQDLAAGRFPASMASRLHMEGLIGDDEEYWPPEIERWADEYEGFK